MFILLALALLIGQISGLDCEGADYGGSDCGRGGPNYDSYGGLDYGGSNGNGVSYVWNGYKPQNVGHTNRQTYR